MRQEQNGHLWFVYWFDAKKKIYCLYWKEGRENDVNLIYLMAGASVLHQTSNVVAISIGKNENPRKKISQTNIRKLKSKNRVKLYLEPQT